jgi:hypothetical protein
MNSYDFRFAFRNLLRHKQHGLLNIAGLAVALAACFILFLVYRYETGFNAQLSGYSKIYQVVTRDKDAEGTHFTGGIPFPFVKALRTEAPDLEEGQYMQNYGAQITLRTSLKNLPDGNKFIDRRGVYFAEPEIAGLFDLKFLRGSRQSLSEPDAVVLSVKTAERFFGDWKQAIGQRINFDNAPFDLIVSGIFEDVPDNSDFPYCIIASYKAFENNRFQDWPLENWGTNSSNHQLYVRLQPGQTPDEVEKILNRVESKYNTTNKSTTRTHFLLPMSDIHFDERFPTMGDHQISKKTLYGLAGIGFLVLLMAGINYVNLATALSGSRGKEFGVRKVLGGSRWRLMAQSFSETFLLVLFSGLLAMVLAYFIRPFVGKVMAVQTLLPFWEPENFFFFGLILVFFSLLAGIYPALVLSGFSPMEALRTRLNKTNSGALSLRRVLVVTQFGFSQMFILATIVAVKQMDYVRSTDLGFDKEAILQIHAGADSRTIDRLKLFKQEMLSRGDVRKASICFDAPGSENSWQSNFAYESTEDKDFALNMKFGDHSYAETYGLKLLAGRFYGPSDTAREYVVNETFLKKVGVLHPEDALGKRIRIGGGFPKPICGVVRDFHAQSLKNQIPPILMMPQPQYMGSVALKLDSRNLVRTRAEIRETWDRMFPEYVFNDRFLDEEIQRFYEQEERMSLMYQVYAALALFISGLGLYGLISFLVAQKTREVGIRKILGASTASIVLLFSKEFVFLLAMAFLLAAPAGWFFIRDWLQGFEYRISIGPGLFAFSFLISCLVACLTVGVKSWKAALANPVSALRNES